jgi:hypothetical protein
MAQDFITEVNQKKIIMKKLTLLLFLATSTICSKITAQQPAVMISDKTGWHKIAETKVNFEKEKDEVAVLIADRFSGLAFHITDASIELFDMEVYFEDGTKKTVKIGDHIKTAGGWSRIIDLPGNEKNIKKIAFTYKTLKNSVNEKAHVEIWGKKTNADKK